MWVLLHTAGALLLALVVLLVCRWRCLGPAARHALWLLVLLKLLTPPFVSWPWVVPLWSLLTLPDGTETDDILSVDSFVGDGSGGDIANLQAPILDGSARDILLSLHVQGDSIPSDDSPAGEESSSFRWDRLLDGAVALWLCGSVVVALAQLRRMNHIRHTLAYARPASPWLIAQVQDLASVLGVSPPRLAVLPGLGSPLIWAGGRACLLWPERLEERLSSEGCRAVLVHELAHLARRDHWVGWLLALAGCVWWWHPLLYFVRRQLNRQAELACDARVVAALPDARRCYAEALLDVCQRQSWTAAATPALGMAGRRRDLERRLVMIMRSNVPSRLTARGLVGIALLGVIVLPAWTLGQVKTQPNTDKAAPADRDKQLQSLEHKLKEVLKDLEAQRKSPAPVMIAEYTVTLPRSNEQFFEAVLDDTPKVDQRDKKLQELEGKVKSLLKEVQALRTSKTTTDPAPTQMLWIDEKTGNQYATTWTFSNPVTSPTATEIALTRTTYKMPAAKAKALGEFLQQHVKASVMETKVEGENLIVTTTPEVQRGIGQFIALIEGKTPPSTNRGIHYYGQTRPQAK